MAKRILAVIRTSTIKQEIESQKKDITEFCLTKGFKEDEIIFVIGFGASARKQNDKYLKMLEEIKTTIEKYSIKYVAVWHLNRLGRTEENLSSLKEYFERNHIQVYIKNPSLVLFNEDGTLNNGTSMSWTLFAMMIKFETLELMEKLHRGREFKKAQKKYIGGRVTYGYRVNESGYYEIDENESKVVTTIFDLYQTGKYGAKKIIAELNEKSLFTRNGKSFIPATINQILRNTDYITNEKYPQLITKEQFEKCREISLKNDVAISKERSIHLGSKLLKCRDCGCSFSINYSNSYNGKPNYLYYCNGAKQGYCKSEVTAIKMEVFDFCIKQVSLNMYSNILLKKSVTDKQSILSSISESESRIESIKSLIKDNERKLSRYNHLYADGKYLSYEDFESDYNKVFTEITNLRSRQSELENKVVSLEKQLKLVSVPNDETSWLKIRQSLLANNDIKQWKEIVDICISYSYLKRVVVNGKQYTAIIIILNDENTTKKLFLYNRRSVFQVYPEGNQISVIMYPSIVGRKVKSVSTITNKNPQRVDLNISLTDYDNYCS